MTQSAEETLEELLKKWQRILRLNHWDIKIVQVTKPWRKSGDIKIDMDNRMAALMIHESVPPEHLEEVTVHELLHLKLFGMDQMIEESLNIIYGTEDDPKKEFAYGAFMLELESTVEDLTKGFLSANNDRKEFWFKRVDRQIHEELGE